MLFLLSACGPAISDPNISSSHLLLQPTPKARLTYVAIGASDTFGLGTQDPQSQSWPADLSELLASGDKAVDGQQIDVRLINLGIPGMHVHDALSNELPVAIDAHPNLITVWLAVNDLADNVPVDMYAHDLDLLLTKLKAAVPHATIVVANVPDITKLPHFHDRNPQTLRAGILAYNTVIANTVQKHQVLLVDLYQQWNELSNHPEYISSDGFHPSTMGYARLAAIFHEVLQQNGK